MTGPPTALDLALVILITVIWPLAEWLGYYPRSLRAIAAGVPGARARFYRNAILPQWAFTACVAALWAVRGRPWAALRIGWGTPLQTAVGGGLAAAMLVLIWRQWRAILARPASLKAVRRSLANVEPLMARTPGEMRGACLMSLTAGICEEFLFRGFVMAYFQSLLPGGWSGLILAALISSILFGFGHVYLGARQIWVSAIAGAVATVIVLAAGSIWPAVLVHAATDLNSFDLGYRAWKPSAQEPERLAPDDGSQIG
jgi:membrane protease YdiL (CAAX protease family)